MKAGTREHVRTYVMYVDGNAGNRAVMRTTVDTEIMRSVSGGCWEDAAAWFLPAPHAYRALQIAKGLIKRKRPFRLLVIAADAIPGLDGHELIPELKWGHLKDQKENVTYTLLSDRFLTDISYIETAQRIGAFAIAKSELHMLRGQIQAFLQKPRFAR